MSWEPLPGEGEMEKMTKTLIAAAAFCGALSFGGTAQAITATDPAPRCNFKEAVGR